MSLFLDKVNTAPIINDDFSYEFKQWVANTIDTLNEVIGDIQSALTSTEIIGASVTLFNAVVDSTYIPTGGALTSFQLPATTVDDIGSTIEIAGQGAGGWKLLTAVGQTIKVGDVGGSANTSVASSNRYDSIKIILVDANTWITLSTQTTGFVIV